MSIHQTARNVVLHPTEPDEFGIKPNLEELKHAWLHVNHCSTCTIILKHAKNVADFETIAPLIAYGLDVSVGQLFVGTELGRFQIAKALIILYRKYHCRVDVRSRVDGMTFDELIDRWKFACRTDKADRSYQEVQRARFAE